MFYWCQIIDLMKTTIAKIIHYFLWHKSFGNFWRKEKIQNRNNLTENREFSFLIIFLSGLEQKVCWHFSNLTQLFHLQGRWHDFRSGCKFCVQHFFEVIQSFFFSITILNHLEGKGILHIHIHKASYVTHIFVHSFSNLRSGWLTPSDVP